MPDSSDETARALDAVSVESRKRSEQIEALKDEMHQLGKQVAEVKDLAEDVHKAVTGGIGGKGLADRMEAVEELTLELGKQRIPERLSAMEQKQDGTARYTWLIVGGCIVGGVVFPIIITLVVLSITMVGASGAPATP